MTSSGFFPWLVTLQLIWKDTGWGTIIYLAALLSIDTELYEAAAVDGADRWRRLWHVTLPGIVPVTFLLLILHLGSILSVGFEQILLQRDAVGADAAEVLDTYVYFHGMLGGQWGITAAAGLVKGVVGLVLVLGANKLAHRFGQEGVYRDEDARSGRPGWRRPTKAGLAIKGVVIAIVCLLVLYPFVNVARDEPRRRVRDHAARRPDPAVAERADAGGVQHDLRRRRRESRAAGQRRHHDRRYGAEPGRHDRDGLRAEPADRRRAIVLIACCSPCCSRRASSRTTCWSRQLGLLRHVRLADPPGPGQRLQLRGAAPVLHEHPRRAARQRADRRRRRPRDPDPDRAAAVEGGPRGRRAVLRGRLLERVLQRDCSTSATPASGRCRSCCASTSCRDNRSAAPPSRPARRWRRIQAVQMAVLVVALVPILLRLPVPAALLHQGRTHRRHQGLGERP